LWVPKVSKSRKKNFMPLLYRHDAKIETVIFRVLDVLAYDTGKKRYYKVLLAFRGPP
jgi:hypothetical protein